MTYFENAVNLIKNDGYGIGIDRYTNGVVYYSLMKNISKTHRTIHFECARNIAKMLIRQGAKVIHRKDNIRALNFTPERVPNNCIRYFTN